MLYPLWSVRPARQARDYLAIRISDPIMRLFIRISPTASVTELFAYFLKIHIEYGY